MATQDFSPESGSGGANTSCDDSTGHENANDTFDNIRDGAGTFATADAATGNAAALRGDSTTDRYDRMDRAIFTIDVSGFSGSSSDITDVTFKIYVDSVTNQLGGGHSISLVTSAPANNADIVAGDYDSLGATKWATDLVIGDMTTSAYNTFTLNATGVQAVKNAIDGDGILKLGIRTTVDADDNEAGLTWANDEVIAVAIKFADNGSNEPTLTITYTTEYTASFTPLAIQADITAISSYVYEQIASFTSLAVNAVVPAFTATFASVWTATITALSVVMSIPSMIAKSRFWQYPTKNTATWTGGTKNSTTFTKNSKSSSSWSHGTKNTTTFTKNSKNTASWTNKDKN